MVAATPNQNRRRPRGFYLLDTKICQDPHGTPESFGVWDVEVTYTVMLNGSPVTGTTNMSNQGVWDVSEQLTNLVNMKQAPGIWCQSNALAGVSQSTCGGSLGTLTAGGTFVDERAGQGSLTQSYYLNGTVPLQVGFPNPPGTIGPPPFATYLNNVYNSSPPQGRQPSISIAGRIVVGTPALPLCSQ